MIVLVSLMILLQPHFEKILSCAIEERALASRNSVCELTAHIVTVHASSIL